MKKFWFMLTALVAKIYLLAIRVSKCEITKTIK